MANSYITVRGSAQASFIEKKSEFIASVSPVSTDEEAVAFVAAVRKKYPDARHNVYAYALRENNISRYSDDGEPKGTAGPPVLEVLNKAEIRDCAVVVTRYFGGVLLGVGGLSRAYTRAAAEGVAAAGVVTLSYLVQYTVTCSFRDCERLKFELSQLPVVTDGADYGAEVTLRLASLEQTMREVEKKAADLTSARAVVRVNGHRWGAI